MKKMSCQDFFDTLLEDNFFGEVNSDHYWGDKFSHVRILDIFKKEASSREIELTDISDWDLEKIS